MDGAQLNLDIFEGNENGRKSKNIEENNFINRRRSLIEEFDPLYKQFKKLDVSRSMYINNYFRQALDVSSSLHSSDIFKNIKKFNEESLSDGDISTKAFENTIFHPDCDKTTNIEQLSTKSFSQNNSEISDGIICKSKDKQFVASSVMNEQENHVNFVNDACILPSNKFDDLSILSESMKTDEENKTKLLELQRQVQNFRNVITFYEDMFRNLEAYFSETEKEYQIRYTDIKQKFDHNTEETQYLDKAYKYTYNRYEELKESYDLLRQNEITLLKSNNDLRKAVEFAGAKINELYKEIAEMKTQHEAEITRLVATNKVNLLKMSGLEKSIDELTRQKKELTLICEEFLAERQ